MNGPTPYATYRILPVRGRGAPRIKDTLIWMSRMLRFIRREIGSRPSLPLAKRWRGWCLGFSTKSYVIYDLDAHDARQYLSDHAISFRSDRVNGPFNALVGNKLAFARTMALHGFRHPRVHGLLERGTVHDLDATRPVSRARDWLAERLEPGRPLVLKPAVGGQGKGIIFLGRSPTALSVNGIAASFDEVDALLSPLRRYLITEFVTQARYAAAIYPDTTNTVRILTLWDLAVDRPFIAAAAHRFGTARSAPVDNWHGGWGGLSSRIDVDGGVLGPGATLSDAGRLCWHEQHPESGAPIAGVHVDGWAKTAATVLAAAARVPEAPAIGWDLVVTDEGCSFLEGNSPPGPFVWQVHGPLLADPRVRRFYEAHGVV
jgi:hypothetical protein